MRNWRYYRVLSYVSFFVALYLSDNKEAFYEYMALALFFEIKDHLQQIEEKLK